MATFDEIKLQLENSFNSDGAQGIEATIQLNIDDLTNFYVDIKNGELIIEEGKHDSPGLTLTFDTFDTVTKIFSGDQAAAMQAFMQGKVKFDGDMALGQKLGSVFKA
jgi:putative sterol carrier protein